MSDGSILKTESTCNGYVHANLAFGLKGRVTGPSELWLIKEADVSQQGGINNFPDAGDNHGASGENILFVDGHVEWVIRAKYILSYELGMDEGRSSP